MSQVSTYTVSAAAGGISRTAGLPGWVSAIVRTDEGVVPLVLRLTLATVMFPHGAQKVFGWFGGYGFEGTMGFLTGTVGLPWILGVLVIAAEFLGSLGLLVGLFGRVAAFGIASVMTGAILTSHLQNGFFMNWSGAQAGEGFEYHLLVLAMALAIMIQGSGQGSIDRALTAARQ